jgi:ABC-type multidrug transport system ATPase subunit
MVSVGKRYGLRGRWVLRDVDVAFRGGTIVRVAGPNGSGKSTLLRVLAGASWATTGRVRRAGPGVGLALDALPPQLPLVMQSYLRHMAGVAGVSPGGADERLGALTEGFGLGDMGGQRLGELSKGTAHKVALCAALAAPARLYVLDEPWSGLDRASQGFLANHLAALRAGGACVVLTDHGERTAELRVDDELAVDDGRIRSVGTPSSSSRVSIVVEARGEAVEALRVHGGVHLRPSATAGRYEVVTDDDHSDRVLLACVTGGVHVVSVGRADGRP